MAICATLLKEAEVYFFDEPSSYLDIHERMRVVRIIQGLAERGKRVLVVEHDLAILDVLCDLLHVVYGERAAYGIFTCLLYTSPSPRDQRGSRMPSSA